MENVGFRAIIENLQGYLTGTKSIETANDRVKKTLLQTQLASESLNKKLTDNVRSAQQAQQRFADAVVAASRRSAEARVKLAETEDRVSKLRAKAQKDLSDKQELANKNANSQSLAQIRRLQQVENAEIALANTITEGQKRIRRSAVGVENADILGRKEINAAQIGLQAALAKQATDAAQALAKQEIISITSAAAQAKLGSGIRNTINAFGPFRAAANAATSATRLLGSTLIAVTGFSNRFAVSLKFGAAAVTAFLTAFTIGAASSFENQLVKIDNLTNLTTEDTEKLSKEILRLATIVPKTPAEIGATAYQVLSSGIQDLDVATSILENSLKAATVAQSNSADVARTTTAVIKAYGEGNISASQTTDILIASTREGRVEFADFSNEIGRLLGLAPSLGIEFDELAAALAGLSNFLPASQAGTALLGVMNQLFSPTAGARDLFKELGTSVEEFRATIDEKGLLPALQELAVASGNNQQIFEKLFPEVRGLTGVLLLMRDAGSENAEILDRIRNSAGITEETFTKANKTFDSQVKLLRNQLNIAFIQLGKEILPGLTASVQKLITWFNKNRDSIVQWANTIATIVVAAIGNFLKGTSMIVKALRDIVGMKGVVIATFVAIGIAIVAALGPASAAYLAVAAMVALLGAIPKFLGAANIPNLASATTAAEIESQLVQLRKERERLQKAVNREVSGPLGIPGTASIPNALGIDTSKQKDLKKVNDAIVSAEAALSRARIEGTAATTDSTLSLKELERGMTDVDIGSEDASSAANKAAEALQALAQEFQSSSIAAGQVSDLTEELGLFGIVSKELAETIGLTAEQAGRVQGYDAYVRAAERAERESFNLARALGTVAEAARNSIAVAQRIVLDVARNALSLTGSAASAVFGRPTQEVAALELQQANRRPGQILLEQQLNPQIQALQDQLDRLRKLESTRTDAIKDQIDNLKDVEDERIALLKKRLELEKENLSELNRVLGSYLNSIEETIGRLEAARPFARNADEQTELEEQIAAFEGNRRAILDAIGAQEENVSSIEEEIDSRESAIDRQVEALERQREAIERSTKTQEESISAQIESLQSQIDAYNRDTEAIQTQIDLYTAYSDILQKQIQAADASLLTEAEQAEKARELIDLTAQQSQIVRSLSSAIGVDLIPEMDAARDAARLLSEMMNILADPTAVNLASSFDAASQWAYILAKANEDLSASAGNASSALNTAAEVERQRQADVMSQLEQFEVLAQQQFTAISNGLTYFNDYFAQQRQIASQQGVQTNIVYPPDVMPPYITRSVGGLVTTPSMTKLGETGIEMVLPLNNISRSKELLRSLPYSLLSSMSGGGDGGRGGVTVQVNGDVNISDPRKDTGPIGDMGWAAARAMGSRGINW